jgi:RNA polymerase sigma-70 factor (ECF subfamily)
MDSRDLDIVALVEKDAAAALYERSGAAKYGVSVKQFAATLEGILRKCLFPSSVHHADHQSPPVSARQKADFCAGLRLEELALASACAAGNECDWQDFISRYRQKMYNMAIHIMRDSAYAAALTDSLFADLYGINAWDGARESKLLSYTGRGSLEGWLRTVMAQEFVNRYRKQKRTVSLEEQTEERMRFAAVPEPACPSDPRLETATDEALAELSAEDRFTLSSYYLDGRTPAEIADALGLHKSSVSRRLDRLATELRKRILARLCIHGMSHAQGQ